MCTATSWADGCEMHSARNRDVAPIQPRSRLRALGSVAAASSWFFVLLYALRVSDDLEERALDVVLIVLGLVAAASASSRRLKTSRLRLRGAERRLEVMGTDVLAWECDASGLLTYIGAHSVGHFGYEPDELLGQPGSMLVHPQELDRLASHLAEGNGWSKERWRCVLKDGSERWVFGSAVPNRAPDGTLLGYTGSTQPLGKDALDEQRLTDIAARVYDRLSSGDILSVFQPILSVETGRLIGAEALTRFPGSDLTPDRWFTDAEEVGLGVELELEVLGRSLAAAHQLPDDIYISVNAGPSTLVRQDLIELLLSSGIPPYRVVLEITEHASINQYDDVLAAISALRAVGVRLAVDDAGAGYASFRHILRLSPEIIKLDRSLIAGLHDDPALRALASAVVAFGRDMSSTITAEGVETLEELRCAQDLGIHAAQGYLFGKPTADWSTWSEWHAFGPLVSLEAMSQIPAARSS
jgi:PAS domain S-box-containing protein